MTYVCSNDLDGCSDFHAKYPRRRQCPCTCHWGEAERVHPLTPPIPEARDLQEFASTLPQRITEDIVARMSRRICPICTVTEYVCPACEEYADKATVLGILEEAAQSNKRLTERLAEYRDEIERRDEGIRSLRTLLAQAEHWQGDFTEACRQRDHAEREIARLRTILVHPHDVGVVDMAACPACRNDRVVELEHGLKTARFFIAGLPNIFPETRRSEARKGVLAIIKRALGPDAEESE